MKEQKTVFARLNWLPPLLLACALLCFVLASLKETVRPLFIVLMILCILGGAAVFYLGYREKQRRVNYFLYDRRRKQRYPVTELDFARADDGICHYLYDYVPNPVELWSDIPRRLQIELQADDAFRALIGYKMLEVLCTLPDGELVDRFLGAEDRTVAFLCRAIRDAGDEDMADFIFKMKRREEESARVVNFFRKNEKLFENRILSYIRRHLDDFYRDSETV